MAHKPTAYPMINAPSQHVDAYYIKNDAISDKSFIDQYVGISFIDSVIKWKYNSNANWDIYKFYK